jgi:methyl-accepting chemotaxis protein
MLEGRVEVTEEMAKDLRTIADVEEIEIFNHEGREAFNKKAEPKEAELLKRLREEHLPIALEKKGILTMYLPLMNSAACMKCHTEESPILGAVKISMSMKSERAKVWEMMLFNIAASIFAILALSSTTWIALRKIVVMPVKEIERNAKRLSEGDMTIKFDIVSKDEVGMAASALQEALQSISTILMRVKDVSKRLMRVSTEIETDSREILEGTKKEADAIESISSSVEELNASISEISEAAESLAVSSEQTATAIEQMSASVSQIAENSNELFESVESTSSSIEQMNTALKEVSENADRLLRSTEDTLSALEEIKAAIKEVENNSRESAALSEKVMQDAATYGLESIEKTLKGMERIKISAETTAEYMNQLGNRSEEIGKILTVIDEIADQTTLLALNAAILAAQAGEHGKGFSVVADEIRNLAERTAFSTQEIASLINNVRREIKEAIDTTQYGLEAVNEGLTLARESSEAFHRILDSARQSSDMAKAIKQATSEQSKAAEFVAELMENVRDMVSQIARATSEQSKGMSLIMDATEMVRNIANQLKKSTEEQSQQSELIKDSTDTVKERSQQIANAIREQKVGSAEIKRSIENIKDIPMKNRSLSFRLNNSLRGLVKDAELIMTEMERFKLASISVKEGILRFGVVPLESPAEMYKRFNPLAEYLSKKLGKKVEIKVGTDFDTAIKEIGTGITQLCYMTPSTFIKANSDYGVKVILKALREGKPYHHSVIIARSDSPITKVEDLRDRSFAFGDRESTSSYIVPRYMLFEAGIDLDDLLFYNFLGHHDEVAKAVLSGEYDAGGVMERTAEKFKEKGLKFIKFSDEIPEFNICVSPEISEEEINRIKDIFLDLRESDPEAITVLKSIDEHYTGFVEATKEDYMGIKEIMNKLGII